jgi:hypothetical protein
MAVFCESGNEIWNFIKAGNFLTGRVTIDFPKKAFHHGVSYLVISKLVYKQFTLATWLVCC